jgi:hypothetical protein
VIKQKIGNTDTLCKNIWEVQLNNKPGLLFSNVFNTKILIATSPKKLEETKAFSQVDTSKPTIYAKSFYELLIQVTDNSINIIRDNVLVDSKELINVLTAVSSMGNNGDIIIGVVCNKECLIVYSITGEGKLIEVCSSVVEGKSLAVVNNLLYCFSDHNVMVFDIVSKKIVKKIALNIEEEITVKSEIRNDIAFIGTKSGYIIAFDLVKGEVNSCIRVSKDPVIIGPLTSNTILAWTINEFFAVEFIGKLKRVCKINVKYPIRDCITFDNHYLYLDSKGQVFNFKVTDDEPYVSSKVLLTSKSLNTFTRVVHCAKNELYCLVIESIEGESFMRMYSEDFVECLGESRLFNTKFKEILPFTFTLDFDLSIDSILILKGCKGESIIELYVSDKEKFVLPVLSSIFTFKEQVVNVVFMAPYYLVIIGEYKLYVMIIVMKEKKITLESFCNSKLTELVRTH